MARIELQSHFIGGIMLVTILAAGTLEPVLTRALAEVDPNLTINSVRTMQQQVSFSFDQERAVASLAGLFGGVALLLAAIGLYGVTAYTVAQRTNEIGIRMALGADRGNVVELVLRGAFRRVVAGLVLGVPLAIAAGRLISSQLYGLSFWDPVALAVAAISLASAHSSPRSFRAPGGLDLSAASPEGELAARPRTLSSRSGITPHKARVARCTFGVDTVCQPGRSRRRRHRRARTVVRTSSPHSHKAGPRGDTRRRYGRAARDRDRRQQIGAGTMPCTRAETRGPAPRPPPRWMAS